MESNARAPGRLRFGLVLASTLLAAASAAAYFGVQVSWPIATHPDELSLASAPAAIDEEELPPGPHRSKFQSSCVICHSSRIALGQPTLTRTKWGETVHKMVAVYGAPLAADAEAQVVEYLLAIQADR